MQYARIELRRPPDEVRIAPESHKAPSIAAVQAASPPAVADPVVAAESLFAAIVEVLRDLEARRQASLGELQKLAVELAVAAAGHLLGSAMSVDATVIEQLVVSGIERLGLSQPLEVRLHPRDLELMTSFEAPEPCRERWPGVEWRADPGVPRGGVRVVRADGVELGGTVQSRLEEIRREWLEGLNHVACERRQAGAATAPLRRFPDRREARERA